ncbi:MAG: TlpA disulfide reductase family protein [Bacteroidota bacterium]
MLRKIAVLPLLVIAACTSTPEGFVVEGQLKGEIENGTSIFLKSTDSLNQLVDIDSTSLTEGGFTFEGNQAVPKLHYLFVDGLRGNVPVIIENGRIGVKFQKDSLNFAELKGTVQNELFMEFLTESRRLKGMVQTMQVDMRNASRAKDTATMNALRDEYAEFQEEAKNFELQYAQENPNALVSALILDKALTTKAQSLLEIEAQFEALTPEIKATKPGKRLEKALKKAKATEIGQVAPDFSGPTPENTLLALNEVKGKVTLIDFWAAWCRPCRMENPNIVAVYDKYKDKGLQVVGVSLDTRPEDWKKAIVDDGLEWNHISNLKRFQDPIAELYNINAIPAAFLLDENGVIVAKNLRGPALEKKVAELLN